MKDPKDRDSAKIMKRQWSAIRNEWKNYVPTHVSPWPLPEHEIFELESLTPCLDELAQRRDEDREYTTHSEIEGLRVAVLHESVALIHKSGNVLRAAASEGHAGFRTWSRSSAYHSAYFAMRGVLGLLGVVVFRGRDRKKDYQLDVFCDEVPSKSQRRPTAPKFAIQIIRRQRDAGHKELWGLFCRMLRITKDVENVWPMNTIQTVKDMDAGSFTYIRHQIHYRSAGWVFGDIDSTHDSEDFSNLAADVRSTKHFGDEKDETFTPSLALYVYSLAMALLEDLGNEIPRLKDEAQRAESFMSNAPWGTGNAFKVQLNGGEL